MSQVRELLSRAVARFPHSDTPQIDAELLLATVLDTTTTWLKTWPETEIDRSKEKIYDQLVVRRAKGEPIAYIIGKRGFWTLDLLCNDSTLIPRPDTETLVRAALDLSLSESASVIDLGTGTGAIALALACEQPKWKISAIDSNYRAIELAIRNQQAMGVRLVEFFVSNWFESVDSTSKFDLIVSNPPYVADDDSHLDMGDVRFEPRSALVSKRNGYDDLMHIARVSTKKLNSGGWLLLEHGYQQGDTVAEYLRGQGYKKIFQRKDLEGQIRVTGGTL